VSQADTCPRGALHPRKGKTLPEMATATLHRRPPERFSGLGARKGREEGERPSSGLQCGRKGHRKRWARPASRFMSDKPSLSDTPKIPIRAGRFQWQPVAPNSYQVRGLGVVMGDAVRTWQGLIASSALVAAIINITNTKPAFSQTINVHLPVVEGCYPWLAGNPKFKETFGDESLKPNEKRNVSEDIKLIALVKAEVAFCYLSYTQHNDVDYTKEAKTLFQISILQADISTAIGKKIMAAGYNEIAKIDSGAIVVGAAAHEHNNLEAQIVEQKQATFAREHAEEIKKQEEEKQAVSGGPPPKIHATAGECDPYNGLLAWYPCITVSSLDERPFFINNVVINHRCNAHTELNKTELSSTVLQLGSTIDIPTCGGHVVIAEINTSRGTVKLNWEY